MDFRHTLLQSIIFLIFGFIFTGCQSKIELSYMQSPQIKEKLRNLVIFIDDESFEAHLIGQMQAYNTKHTSQYFNIVADTNKQQEILKLAQYNESGLTKQTLSFDGLENIHHIITGKTTQSYRPNKYQKEVTNTSVCLATATTKDGKTICVQHGTKMIQCVNHTYYSSFSANIANLRGHQIYANTFYADFSNDICDNQKNYHQKENVQTTLNNTLITDFINAIAPTKIFYTVILLDDIDIKVSNDAQTKFKKAIELLENKDFVYSQAIIQELYLQYNHSATLAYLMGIFAENRSEYLEAQHFYDLAMKNAVNNNIELKEISKALARVTNLQQEIENIQKLGIEQ